MNRYRVSIAGWIARVLAIVFLAVQAYAWWDESQARAGSGSWVEQWAIVTHVLPALVLIAALVIGWRWPLVGAIGFLGYAVATVFSYAPEWGYAWFVTVPPLVIGVLFLTDWLLSRRAVSPATTSGAP